MIVSSGCLLFRGSERTRTAVAGFADQCLATRPRNLWEAKNRRKKLTASSLFYLYRSAVKVNATRSTSPLIGGLSLATFTHAFCTTGCSFMIRFMIR